MDAGDDLAQKPSKRPPKLDKAQVVHRVRDAVNSGDYRILPHARVRCSERDVSAPDIEDVLLHGHRVPRRDRYDEPYESWSYCYEGATVDDAVVRVVIAFDKRMLIVTVVRLGEKE